MEAPLDYAQDGAIVTLTLNAPDIRNAISGAEMIDALEDACERLNADMSVRAAILTGAGSAFSSGGNVKKMHDGGAWLLQRIVGYSKACEMAFTGDMLSAAEALACGLVSKVVPDAELMTEARKLAQRIAVNPPHAVRMTKRLIREGRHVQLATLLELSAAMQSLAHATADPWYIVAIK